MGSYVGRFAPSPTGPLHKGSLVAALASWLDAKAHQGRWLVRIEDVDQTRCHAAHATTQLQQLAAHGLSSTEPVIWQTQRVALYEQALLALQGQHLVYPCTCSRTQILQAQASRPGRGGELVYPGTCRQYVNSAQAPNARAAWRFCVNPMPTSALPTNTSNAPNPQLQWHDRRLGHQAQDVPAQVGDFVIKRADGLFAYQLAVVVDDAKQGVTHVVRGQDLADNTPRQILLQRALGFATPLYMHTPLVRAANGEKLSKQNGAEAIQPDRALDNLIEAASALNLQWPQGEDDISTGLTQLVTQWQAVWRIAPR